MDVWRLAYQTWGHRLLQALVESLPDEEARARVEAANADVMVACNWRTWIPPEIFNAPRLGTLNVHDSLLPAYAGFAPLNWALINGEPEVGITAHVMDEQLDRGSIILQPRVPVEPADTIGDLFAKTLVLFGPTTIAALDHMEHATGERRAQDLTQATFFHKRADEDNRIDWTWPAQDIANLVRAQADPYPNAYCFHGERRMRGPCGDGLGGARGRHAGPDLRPPGRRRDRRVRRRRAPRAQPRLVLEQVRTDNGEELAAGEYFERMGGYLTSHPLDGAHVRRRRPSSSGPPTIAVTSPDGSS